MFVNIDICLYILIYVLYIYVNICFYMFYIYIYKCIDIHRTICLDGELTIGYIPRHWSMLVCI